MFSEVYEAKLCAIEEIRRESSAVPSANPESANLLLPYLWSSDFGRKSELDQELRELSAMSKRVRFQDRVYAVAPLYVSSFCAEQCTYCNYRAGNKISIDRRRLTSTELGQEITYLVECKGIHTIELVYASDPAISVDQICDHVAQTRELLEAYDGGTVGLSAEPLDENDYRKLVAAGLDFAVVWQETYDREVFRRVHPAGRNKSRLEYRLDTFDRMLMAGLPHIGMGVLSGLGDWRMDWAMLALHEDYIRYTYNKGAAILGIPRLKPAPGALLQRNDSIPTDEEFRSLIALHNLFRPGTAAFVSTREDWDMCVFLAQGGGCLFTFNCSTIPGGYSLGSRGTQFLSGSYDIDPHMKQLREVGIEAVRSWSFPLASLADSSSGNPQISCKAERIRDLP